VRINNRDIGVEIFGMWETEAAVIDSGTRVARRRKASGQRNDYNERTGATGPTHHCAGGSMRTVESSPNASRSRSAARRASSLVE
jgi:hypothetical protein